MRSLLWIVVLLAVPFSACKKPKPSEQYAQALSLHASLYAQSLDDSYLDPRMAEVEALLRQVDSSSLDYPEAVELLKKISTERTRVEAEEKERQEAMAKAMEPTVMPSTGTESAPAAAEPTAPPPAQDAGPSQPVAGMSITEFQQRFGGCFESGPSLEVEGKGQATSYQLKNIANCRDRYPGFDTELVIVQGQTLVGTTPRSSIATESRYTDGGLVPPDAGS